MPGRSRRRSWAWDDDALYFFADVIGAEYSQNRSDPMRILTNSAVTFELGTPTPARGNGTFEPEDLILLAAPCWGRTRP